MRRAIDRRVMARARYRSGGPCAAVMIAMARRASQATIGDDLAADTQAATGTDQLLGALRQFERMPAEQRRRATGSPDRSSPRSGANEYRAVEPQSPSSPRCACCPQRCAIGCRPRRRRTWKPGGPGRRGAAKRQDELRGGHSHMHFHLSTPQANARAGHCERERARDVGDGGQAWSGQRTAVRRPPAGDRQSGRCVAPASTTTTATNEHAGLDGRVQGDQDPRW